MPEGYEGMGPTIPTGFGRVTDQPSMFYVHKTQKL
jgi:hypothetical protein